MAQLFNAERLGESAGSDEDGIVAFPPRYLRSVGEDVATVIDVGVHKGTKSLYDSFPDRHFILVDPQTDCEAMLECAPRQYEFINKAVGAAAGTLTLNAQGAKSGFVERTELSRRNGPQETYEVPVTTLDAIIEEHKPSGPFGLKIDTEGYELEVLKGLVKHAADVSFIVCEASIRRRFVNSYVFSELVIALRDKGFEFYTFLNHAKRRPRFYDVLFLKPNHPFFD